MTFKKLRLTEPLLRAIRNEGYTTPTSIQELEENTAFFETGPLPEEIQEALLSIEVADQRLLNPGNWNA